MMNRFFVTLVLGTLAMGVTAARAATYGDSTSDTFTGAGGGILDITSVEVNNNATDLIFKINLAGNPTSPTDWGKYMIGIDSVVGGDSTGNGWVRPISMSSGMDYWIGSWADSGNGAEVWKFTSWGLQSATYGSNPDSISIAKDSSSVTLQFKFAGLGLGLGSSFAFDVYTSGGGSGDGAVDALANPSQTISDWGNAYNSGGLVYNYTVPEPSALALLGLGGLAVAWRAVRRKA